MLDSAMKTIKKYDMLSYGDRVIVGVSGGPDSMALLNFLHSLKNEYSLYVHVCHINHMLRDRESEEETLYVREFCKNLDIPCSTKYVDIDSISKIMGLSLEEAGRMARYDFFADTAKEVNANKVAIAHNMNDQAETVLMRIMRGTGLHGLCGIKPVRDSIYIRPFIYTSRCSIEKYCEANNLKPRIDSSNLEPVYARNRIRLELIPYIKENYNSNIEYTLSSMTELLSDDNDFIDGYAGSVYRDIAVCKDSVISIDIKVLKKLHNSIKKRIVRKAVEQVKGNLTGIENKHIELILSISDSGRAGSAVELPGRITARVAYNLLNIFEPSDETCHKFCYSLGIPGCIYIPEASGTLESEIFNNNIDYINSNRFVKYFDYDKIKGSLCVRSRSEGDYIIPLGMKGSKRIKELFIDMKIPRSERDKIPLVSIDNEVVWVVGYKVSNSYKIDNGTVKVLKLEFRHPGGKSNA